MKKIIFPLSFVALLVFITTAQADVFAPKIGGLFTQVQGGGGGGTGDFVGPSSSTDNAAVRFDGTTGKLGQNSGVIIDDSNNVSGVGTLATGAQTITSASSNCLTVGPNGATNPSLSVDCSVSGATSGIKSVPTNGSNFTLQSTSPNANADLFLKTKGTGAFAVTSQNINLTGSSFGSNFSGSGSGGTVWGFSYGGNSGSGAGNDPIVDFNLFNTRSFNTGNFALQQNVKVRQSGLSSAGASTITMAAQFSVDGAPLGGTNLTLTNAAAIHVPTVALTNTTNGYGAYFVAPTGATNNYAGYWGGNTFQTGKPFMDGTVTAAGTTGAQTINKPSGTVNLAALATSLVVTNSLVTANTMVYATIMKSDTSTLTIRAIPAAGSFTIIPDSPPAAEMKVGFYIVN